MRGYVCILLCVAACLSEAAADVISYLRFEEGSGYGAYDQTGLMNGELLGFDSVDPGGGDTGYNGWSTNVAGAVIPLSGDSNTGSLRYSGGGEFVDLSNMNTLSLGTDFTIEMYFRADDPDSSNGMIGLSPYSQLYYRLKQVDGTIYFSGQFQDYLLTSIEASGVEADVWYHFALVKTVGGYSIYIDGELIYTTSLPSGTDGPYIFPGNPATGYRTVGEGFRGWIDEVRISDEALTPDQFLCAVPEPESLFLFGAGIAFLFRQRRRRIK